MASWQPRIAAGARRKYLGIVEALEADIYAGILKPGDRLPAQRKIANQLGVDLTTVTRAFNEARQRGLLDATTGRGSFIREHVTAKLIAHISEQRPLLDLSMNSPPQPLAAGLQQAISQGISQIVTGSERVLQLQYQHSAGNPEDRNIAAAWLAQTLAHATADTTLICGGAQAALYAILQTIGKPGDVIACGEWVYPGLKSAAACRELQLQALTMDKHGIEPEAFETACQQRKITAVYMVPAIDNPTTATLPVNRRQQLADIAERYRVIIIEDDPYSTLDSQPLPPVAGLLPRQSWYIRTLAKCVSPALRVAYLVAPDAVQATKVANVLGSTNVMAPPLMAALASLWLRDGRMARFAKVIREENQQRQAIARQAFARHDYQCNTAGHHGWLTLPAHWTADEFSRQARLSGVSVIDGQVFSIVSRPPIDAVRISLGLLPDHEAIHEALGILANLLTDDHQFVKAIV